MNYTSINPDQYIHTYIHTYMDLCSFEINTYMHMHIQNSDGGVATGALLYIHYIHAYAHSFDQALFSFALNMLRVTGQHWIPHHTQIYFTF